MGIIVLINLGLMAVMAQITGYEADVARLGDCKGFYYKGLVEL